MKLRVHTGLDLASGPDKFAMLVGARRAGKSARLECQVAAALQAGITVIVTGPPDGRFQGLDEGTLGRLLFSDPPPAGFEGEVHLDRFDADLAQYQDAEEWRRQYRNDWRADG